jgi:hypothetical protein
MRMSTSNTSMLSFPASPSSSIEDGVVGTLSLRRFGDDAVDLEIDFSVSAAEVAAQLLRACTRRPDGAAVDESTLSALSLGHRLAALLALAGAVDDEPLQATLRCARCNEPLEATLPIADLLAYHERAVASASLHVPVDDERVLTMRRPTARDLERWGVAAPFERMARDLLVGAGEVPETLPPAWLETLERALADADPLIDFHLTTDCPECGASGRYGLDLGALALRRLRAAHDEMLATVHRLASTYHWSEREILSLPPARRRVYLAMIEAGR